MHVFVSASMSSYSSYHNIIGFLVGSIFTVWMCMCVFFCIPLPVCLIHQYYWSNIFCILYCVSPNTIILLVKYIIYPHLCTCLILYHKIWLVYNSECFLQNKLQNITFSNLLTWIIFTMVVIILNQVTYLAQKLHIIFMGLILSHT